MSSMKCRLTKKAILDAEGTVGKQDFLVDTECSGLRVVLSHRGSELSKSFQYYAKHNGRPIKQVIKAVTIDNGLKPADIEKARAVAREWRTRLKSGETMNDILGSSTSMTLGDLLSVYIKQYKERSPDGDWRKVERQLFTHIRDRNSKLWVKQANDISTDELLQAFNPIKGKTNTLRQLRAALNSAYALALKKTTQKPKVLINCGIKQNPASDWIVTHSPKSREFAFSQDEVHCLWESASKIEDPIRSNVFRLWMLFGGTRIAQLERLTWEDVLEDTEVIVIKDKKTGQLEDYYNHKLPITRRMLKMMHSISAGNYIFSADNGLNPLPNKYLYDTWLDLKEELKLDNKLSLDSLRKTVTAYFIHRDVSKDTRNLFFSHEKSGVEWNNYLKSEDYLEKKRHALAVWHELLK